MKTYIRNEVDTKSPTCPSWPHFTITSRDQSFIYHFNLFALQCQPTFAGYAAENAPIQKVAAGLLGKSAQGVHLDKYAASG